MEKRNFEKELPVKEKVSVFGCSMAKKSAPMMKVNCGKKIEK